MKKLGSRGFTLVELLVATALTGILIIVVMSFMVNSFVQTTVDSARSDLLRESQQALDDIGRNVRLSSSALTSNSIDDPYAPEQGQPRSWDSSDSTVILATAATDSDGSIIFSDPLNYISEKNNVIYFLRDGTLYRRTLAADVEDNRATSTCPASADESCKSRDSVLVNNVASFRVTYHDNLDQIVTPESARSVRMEIQLKDKKFGQNLESRYVSRVVFRNE